ncbi:MAG: HEPN domain-containing protein [bacterium]
MTDNFKALINYRIEQDDSALKASQTLVDEELWRDSVNRSYYADFYALLDLLALKGMGTSKHSGAISLFDREFVKAGIFPKDLSATLHRTFDMRQEADYEEQSQIEESDVRDALAQARAFVQQVRQYIGVAA